MFYLGARPVVSASPIGPLAANPTVGVSDRVESLG